MSKKNIILITIVIVAATGLLIWGWQKNEKSGAVQGVAEQAEQAETIKINLVMEGTEGLPTKWEFKKETTLIMALQEINQVYPVLNLQTKDYGEMGILVEQMAGQKNGTDNKYWQYFVNGAQPMVGADKYVLQENDQVEWKFAKSEF
jgi:hypothetical protein